MNFKFSCQLGTTTNGEPFAVSEEQWATHVALLGPTGQGKSRLMWQMMREHRRSRRGFCSIDTGDLANDFLADVAQEVFLTGNYGLLKKIHYVKLSPLRMPRYDPWTCHLPVGLHPEMRELVTHHWRHARVHELMRVFQANTTGSVDFVNQPRRHRVMTNIFLALSCQVDGKRLAMEDVFIFLDPLHKFHPRAVDRVAPFLPDEIRRELELIGGFKRLEDLRREVESSINSLRMVLGGGLKAMLSGTCADPCLDLKAILDRGDYLIVDAQQSSYVNHEQNVAMASLLAMDYCETAMNLPRDKRRRVTMFVDETPELLAPLGREIGRWLRILRKYGVACCLSFQDLVSMKRDEFDLAPIVLGQCGTIVSFRSRWPTDAETLSRVLMTGNLSFEPLIHEVERHPGHQFMQIDDFSETAKRDVGRSNTTGRSSTTGMNRTQITSHATSQNWVTGGSKQAVMTPNGHTVSETRGTNRSQSAGASDTVGLSSATSQSSGASESQGHSETEGWAMTVSHRLVPLPVVVREAQQTGQLQEAIHDQFARFIQDLHGQEQRHAIVLAPGMKKAIQIITAEVKDPFQSISAQTKAVEAVLRRLYEMHDYYFQPSLDPAEAEARVADFVAAARPKGGFPESSPAIHERRHRTNGAARADKYMS